MSCVSTGDEDLAFAQRPAPIVREDFRPSADCAGPKQSVSLRYAAELTDTHEDQAGSPLELCGLWKSPQRSEPILLWGEGLRSDYDLHYLRLIDADGDMTPGRNPNGDRGRPDQPTDLAAVCLDVESKRHQMIISQNGRGTSSDTTYLAWYADADGRWQSERIGVHWSNPWTLFGRTPSCTRDRSSDVESLSLTDKAEKRIKPCDCAWKPLREFNDTVQEFLTALEREAKATQQTLPAGPDDDDPQELFTQYQPNSSRSSLQLDHLWIKLLDAGKSQRPIWNEDGRLFKRDHRVHAFRYDGGWRSTLIIRVEVRTKRGLTGYYLTSPFVSSRFGTSIKTDDWRLSTDGWLSLKVFNTRNDQLVEGSLRLHADPAQRDFRL